MQEIIMYTTKTWPHCTTAKKFLAQKSISFIEKDVNADKEAAAELMSKGVMAVPSFKIGEEMVVGLDQQKILQLLQTPQ